MEIHLTTTECHLPYGITQCYLPPDTSEHTLPSPQPDRLVLDLPTIYAEFLDHSYVHSIIGYFMSICIAVCPSVCL